MTSSAAWSNDAEIGLVDSRIVATAVTAQILSLTPALLIAGPRSSPGGPLLVNDKKLALLGSSYSLQKVALTPNTAWIVCSKQHSSY